MGILVFALAIALSAPAAAQVTYKCKNAAGKITYASKECRDLGLSPAGTVADRTSVAPAAGSAAPAKPKAPAPAGKAPEERCLTVKRGKGDVVTLCGDALKAYEGKSR